MTKLMQLPREFEQRSHFGWFTDFVNDIDAAEVVVTASDAGTAAVGDAVGGILPIIPSDGTVADNDETYIESPNEIFKFAADKPLIFEARVQFTEANVDDANVLVGVLDAVGANTLQDNGAGPPASYSGAVFFKVDGGTVWQFETSIAGTQTTTATNVTAGGASYQTLRIEVRPFSSTQCEAVPFIDGVQCKDANGNLIKHIITFASATEMQVGAGQKNGDITNVETLNIDYIGCFQLR